MHLILSYVLATFALLVFNQNAQASLNKITTSKACGLLSEQGLQTTKDWSDYGEYVGWGCNSPYKDIGKGAEEYSLANNLAFYVDGDRSTVEKAYLVLNVNNRNDAKLGHQNLLESSKALCQKVTGEKLPTDIASAIKNGKPAKKKFGASALEVKRMDWPTGKGYEIHFIIRSPSS